jgi:hypothetical protein
MTCLPSHGRVQCSLCHYKLVEFDRTITEQEGWRITANPLAWGNDRPEVLVLGFSKGPNAVGALAKKAHNEIPYAGQRLALAKILSHVGLIPRDVPERMRRSVDHAIGDMSGRFAWGSLIRCTVERRDGDSWKGSGGGMLDKFVATAFGQKVASNCVKQHLAQLPNETKLVVLFGLGTKLGYVRAARRLIQSHANSALQTINEIAYQSQRIVYVHVEHFASQGRLIPDWLGVPDTRGKISERARWGVMAQEATRAALQ